MMATYGNRPALYKPTDFSSQQKRLAAAVSHIASAPASSEVKKEEEKVTFKIQQRPALTGPDQKSSADMAAESTKVVKILTDSLVAVDAAKKMNHVVADEKPGGVAQKDLDKIAKLKEFMAKQQAGQTDDGKKPVPPVHKMNVATIGEKYIPLPSVIKSNLLNISKQAEAGKIANSTVAGKLPNTKSLSTPDSRLLNGDKNPPGILTGVVPSKMSPLMANGTKPLFKENKDPCDLPKDEKSKMKGQREVPKDAGKKKAGGVGIGGAGSGGRGGINRVVKSVPTSVSSTAATPLGGGKGNKGKETNQRAKQQTTKPPNSAVNNGTRPKVSSSKSPMNNQQHKTQNRQYDRPQMHGVNSYYSQANKAPGFPNNEVPPWLPYSMNPMNMNGNQGGSILGQPTGPRVDFVSKPGALHHTDKNIDQAKNVINGPSSGAKKVVTVEASKDKSEQKKSLDFVKSFFDTDPEVQYNRKINAEKRNAAASNGAATAPVVSAPTTAPISKDDSPGLSRSHLSSTTTISSSSNSNNLANNMNTHFASQNDLSMTSQINNHFSSHSDANSHFSSITDNHVNSAGTGVGTVNSYGGVNHSNSRLISNNLSNSQVNNQSFVHSSQHIAANMQANHIPPGGSHIAAGSHITGSMASSYSSVYHHTNVSNMAAHNAAAALHPNPGSAGHFQGGGSTVSGVHMGGTAGQLHPAITSHPSSLHRGQPQQQTYDLYSQVNQMNPLLTEPDRFIKYCSVMNNYPGY